jgi:ADP-ribosyl-[dinitrogen reductase] hydrolase
LLAERVGFDMVILREATLDDDPGRKPELHIFAAAEVPWLEYGPQIVASPQWEPGHR